MNIYEQLNKINDTESLSEKYNVKNAKELKKLKENLITEKTPFEFDEKTYILDGRGISDSITFYVNGKRNNIIISSYEDLTGEEDSRKVSSYEEAKQFVEDVLTAYGEAGEDSISMGWYLDESLKEDTHESSKSTKDRVEAAKQIIADLESKGFVNSDIASIGFMIKETIDSRYPEYVSPMNRLRKAFPDFNI